MFLDTFKLIPANITKLYLFYKGNSTYCRGICPFFMAASVNAIPYSRQGVITPMEILQICLEAERKSNSEKDILQSVVMNLMVTYFKTDTNVSRQEIIKAVYSKSDTISETIQKTLNKGAGRLGTYPEKAIKVFELNFEIANETKELASAV